MRSTRFWPTCAAAAVLAVAPLGAADPAPEAKTGLPVGTKAPAFTLKDQSDKERSLEDFLKRGKVVVVFHRSAEW